MNNQQSVSALGTEWIPLAEAAHLTPYSAEYLSLLARKGRLTAKKVDNVWFTTRAILKDYLSKQLERAELLSRDPGTYRPFIESLEREKEPEAVVPVPAPVLVAEQAPQEDTEKAFGAFMERFTTYVDERVIAQQDPIARALGFFRRAQKTVFTSKKLTVALFILLALSAITPVRIVSAFTEGIIRDSVAAFKDARTVNGFRTGTHENEILLLGPDGEISIFGAVETEGQFKSLVEDGIAPIVVTSKTQVDNLNAEYIGGRRATDFTLAFVTQNGNVTYEDVSFEGKVEIGSTLLVRGATKLLNALQVDGNISVLGDAFFSQDITVEGNASFKDLITVPRLIVEKSFRSLGSSVFEGSVRVEGSFTAENDVVLGDGDSIVEIDSEDWSVDDDGRAEFKRVSVEGALSAESLSIAEDGYVGGALTVGDYVEAPYFVGTGSATSSLVGGLSVGGDFALDGVLYDGTGFAGVSGYILQSTGAGTEWVATSSLGISGSGTVTSINASGGTTGLSFAGGPISTTGTLTLGGTLGVANGGTGTTTAPAYGQVLLGNSSGGYDLVATSSLGIVGGSGGGFSTTSADYHFGTKSIEDLSDVASMTEAVGDLLSWNGSSWTNVATSSLGITAGSASWGAITGTLSSQTDLQNALDAKLSLSAWYATTTDGLDEGVTNRYFSNTLARQAISETITGIDYDNSSGIFSTSAGYAIPLSASTTNWNTFYDTPSSRITSGTGLSWTGNTLNAEVQSSDLLSYLSLASWYGTTTDGLDEGSSNLYYTDGRVATYLNTVNKSFFFSTTSADFWETQQVARTADDLSNNSIEDLSDVAAMTENFGDLLYWNGSSWADIATSSLGITSAEWGNITGTLSDQTDLQNALNAKLSLTDWYATTTDGLDEGVINRYFSDTLARQAISETITGIDYNNGTGVFSTTAGYAIPLTASTTEWATAYSWGDHSLAGYSTSGYPFALAGNATSSLTQFNGGLTSYASTTIGAGGTNGLTVVGNATTTGNAYFAGNVNLASGAQLTWGGASTGYITGTGGALNVVTSGGDYSFAGGAFRSGGSGTGFLIANGSGNTTSAPVFVPNRSDTSTGFAAGATGNLNAIVSGAEVTRWTTTGFGIGTSTPSSRLSVQGNSYVSGTSFFGGALTATSTVTLANYTNGALGVNASGALYTYSTSTWSFASSTLLADSNTFSGANIFTTAPRLGTLTGLVYGNNGSLSQVATTSATLGLGLSGTLTTLGSSDSLSIATSSLFTGTTGQVAYFSGTNQPVGTSSLAIGAGGNIGIGTTNPGSLLEINGTAQAITAARGLVSINSNSTQAAGVGGTIGLGGSDGTQTRDFANIGGLKENSSSGNYAGYLSFATRSHASAPAERMRIDSSGNVGIGTTTPAERLSVQGNALISGNIFTANLTATGTVSVANLTVGALNGPLQANNGVVSATTSVGAIYGGTGQTSYVVGDILYADSAGSLARLPVGGAGQVLKVTGGIPAWGADITSGGGGGATAWSTTTDSLAIYPTDTSDVLILGNSSTSTANSILEVFGTSYFSSNVGIGTTSPSQRLSVQGSGLFSGNLSSANLTATGTVQFTSLTNGALATNASGQLYSFSTSSWSFASSTLLADSNTWSGLNAFGNISATNATTTSFGINSETFTDLTGAGLQNIAGVLSLNATGDWTGTFDGQEGSFYLNRANHTGTQLASTISDFNASVNSYIHASSTIPKTYTANTFTGAQTLNGGLTIGSLNGPLQANNGVVSATTSVGVLYGGTGLTGAPSYGNLLVGNSSGGYTLTATSSLGLQSTLVGTQGQIAYFSGTNQAVGTSSLFVATNGDVGVGTVSPTALLDVSGVSSRISLRHPSLAHGMTTWAEYTDRGGVIQTSSVGSLSLSGYSGSSAFPGVLMYGTSNAPNAGVASFTFIGTKKSGTGAAALSATDTVLNIANQNTYLFTVLGSGNVGLGTTSPYAKLSVVGEVVASNFTATTTAVNTFPNLLATNATTTSFGLNSETFTDLTGAGLQNIAGVLSLNATGDWTGTFDGQEGSYYLNRANHTGTQLASTISDFNDTVNAYIHASSTIPKTYTANTFTGAQTLNGGLTIGSLNGVFYGVSGVTNAVATSTPTLGLGLSYSGTLGSFVGGSSGALSIATSSLFTGTTGQVAYFSGTNQVMGTSSLFVSAGGKVGVGTTTPQDTLSVVGTVAVNGVQQSFNLSQQASTTRDTPAFQSLGTAANQGILGLARFSSSQTGPGLYLGKSGGTAVGDYTAVSANHQLGSLSFQGADGTQFIESAYIQGRVDGAVSSGIVPTQLRFVTMDGAGSNNVGAIIASTSQFQLRPNTLVSAPDYSFTNDVDTGLYRATTNAIGIVTAGSERLRVTATGSVGVGTTTPGAFFSVQGNALVSGNTATAGLTATGTVQFTGLSNGLVYANGSGVLSAVATSSWTFASSTLLADSNIWSGSNTFNTAPRLGTLTGVIYGNNGSLNQVATTSATLGLGLSGTLTTLGSSDSLSIATSSLFTGTTGQVAYFSGTNQPVGTSSLFIATSGNVGIGTTTPVYGLDVQTGSIRVNNNTYGPGQSGTIYLGDGTVTKASGSGWLFDGGMKVTGGQGIESSAYGFDVTGGTPLGNAGISMPASTELGLWAGSLERVRISSGGNVGIGSTTPAERLSVQGNALISGNTSTAGLTATGTVQFTGLSNGLVYASGSGVLSAVATSSWTFASSTLLADSNTFSGLNSFTGATTTFNNLALGTGLTLGTGTYLFSSGSNLIETNNRITVNDSVIAEIVDVFGSYLRARDNIEVALGTDLDYSLGYNSADDSFRIADGSDLSANTRLAITSAGNVGIASTTPYANLSVHANNGGTNTTLFAIGSSTASATTTHFAVNNQGQVGIGMSPVSVYNLSLPTTQWFANDNAHIYFSGTNTYIGERSNSSGLELRGGGNSGISTVFINSGGELSLGDSGPSYKLQVTGTTTNGYFGISSLGGVDGDVLAVSGAGSLGLGTTSPYANLSVHANNGGTNTTLFAVASSTASATTTLFSIGNTGTITTALSNGLVYANGSGVLSAVATSSWTFASSTLLANTNTWSGPNSFTNGLTANTFTLGTLNGPLQANNGVVSATTSVGVLYGGTGASTFTNNRLLTGNGTSALVDEANLTFDGSTLNVAGTINAGGGVARLMYEVVASDRTLRLDNSSSQPTGGFEFYASDAGYLASRLKVQNNGLVGVSSSTPYAKFSIHTNNGDVNRTLFAIGSSTASATTTFLSVSNTGALTLTSGLNGPLQANAGLVSATTSIGVLYGGTGLTSAPSYGQVLLGNGSGGYTLTATSSLGLYNYFTNSGASTYLSTGSNLGVGSTSPFARLSVHAGATDTYTPYLFAIASSSASYATSTLFSVAANGTATFGNENGAGDATMQFGGNTNAWSMGYASTTKSFVIASSTNLSSNIALTIAKGGNVGIGSSTPGALLSVAGTAFTNAHLPNGTYTNNLSAYDLGATGARWNALWAGTVNVGTSTFSLAANSASGLGFYNAASAGGTQVMTLATGGNVGIGSSTPGAKLAIQGGANNAGTTLYINERTRNDSDNAIYVAAGSATGDFVVKTDGKVGIGRTDPASVNDISDTLVVQRTGINAGIAIISGTSNAASLTFGDTSDEIAGRLSYNNSTNALSVYTNSSERMTIDSSGNVGIGTSTPNDRLVVGDSVSGTVATTGGTDASQLGAIYATNIGAAGAGLHFGAHASDGAFWLQSRSASSYATNYNLLLNPNGGNVGIGTSTPLMKLTVNGAATGGIATLYDGATYGIRGIFQHMGNANGINSAGGLQIAAQGTNNSTSGSGDINFFVTGSNSAGAYTDSSYTTAMKIRYDGNVGIGTTTPSARLDVSTTAGSAVAIASFYTGGMSNNQQNYLAIGNSLASNNGFGILYNHNSTSGSRYLALKAHEASAGQLVLTASGDVGIGTTTPQYKLHVYGAGAIQALQNTNAAAYASQRILNDQSSTGRMLEVAYSGSSYASQFLSGGIVGEQGSIATTGSYPLSFGTANAQRMTITSAGNVGIGTTTPAFLLEVGAGAATTQAIARINGGNSGTASGAALYFGNAGTSNTAIGNTSAVIGGAYDSDLMLYSANDIRFRTGGSSEALFLAASGNVGIGTTTPSTKLQVYSNSSNGTLNELLSVDGGTISTTVAGSGVYTSFRGTSNTHYGGVGGYGNGTLTGAGIWGGTVTGIPDLYVTSAANVGIGTSTPDAKLNIYGGNLLIANNQALQFEELDGSNRTMLTMTTGNVMTFGNANNNVAWNGFDHTYTASRTAGGADEAILFTATTNMGGSDEVFQISDGGGNLLTVMGDGDVGIGTIAPATQLEVSGTQPTGTYTAVAAGTRMLGHLNLQATDSYTTQKGGRLTFSGYYDSGNTASTYGAIQGAKFNATNGNSGGGLEFLTGDNSTGLFGTRMVITDTGLVGIGTTTPSSSLQISGAVDGSPNGAGVHLGMSGNYASMELSGSSGGFIDFTQTATDFEGRILYDNASDYMAFTTNGGERVRISSTGNLGIGSTTPWQALSVNGSIAMTSGNIYSTSDVQILNGSNAQNLKAGSLLISNTFAGSAPTNGAYILGNVGIGTTTTGYKLGVVGSASFGNSVSTDRRADFDTSGRLSIFYHDNSLSNAITLANLAATGAAGLGSAITFPLSSDGSNLEGARISAITENSTHTGATADTSLVFYNNINGGAVGERLRIHSSGNIGIGSSTPASLLSVAGAGYFTGSVGIGTNSMSSYVLRTAGNIGPSADASYTLGGNGMSWACVYYDGGSAGNGCVSDRRLKENIEDKDFGDALTKLSALKLHSFTYKNAEDSNPALGFIAQEVMEVAPEFVFERADGYYGVKYSDVQWLTFEALQELAVNVESLTSTSTDELEEGSYAKRFFDALYGRLVAWFENAENGIANLFVGSVRARETVCVGETCVTEDQLKSLLETIGQQESGGGEGQGDEGDTGEGEEPPAEEPPAEEPPAGDDTGGEAGGGDETGDGASDGSESGAGDTGGDAGGEGSGSEAGGGESSGGDTGA